MMKNFIKNNIIRIRMLLNLLVIVGAINWLLTAFNYNLVELLSNTLNNIFNSNLQIDKIIYIVVGISAIILAINRNTWLPFLGQTALPSQLISQKIMTDANKTINVKVPANTKVIYWAATGENEEQDVWSAYGDFSNGGVVMSDNNGNATLSIQEGAGYIVPTGRKIKRHVHYRYSLPKGLLSEIKTIYY